MSDIQQGYSLIGASNSYITIHSQTLTERLESEKKSLESRLADINNALNLLTKNPDTQQLLDAIQKVSRIY